MEDVRIHAPELTGGQAWLNVDRALTLRELRGSIVILDFWTYCCINCLHVLPTLQTIEHRFQSDPVVVIGVHSGKFSAEHDPMRIRDAVARYGVEHPVVVDDNMSIWSRYGIRSWPTLVVIRPDGTIAAIAPGEPRLEVLDDFVRQELERARKAGTLATSAVAFSLPIPVEHTPLLYPGKVSVLPDGRLAISDSGHHRVLITDAAGEVQATIGSGLCGFADGSFDDAAFDDPQGSTWHDGSLYIADARNHLIRRANLETRVVDTVAGNGMLGSAPPAGRAPAREVALRSPWDLCSVGNVIFVAMAGSHQIWRLWPKTGVVDVYAGTGVEALLDGAVHVSAWAQPSGLSARDGVLYVADSESSAIRAIWLDENTVDTLIGHGLFDFGDDEGAANETLLQHALGVVALDGGLLIADTYNGKIKRLGRDGIVKTVVEGLSEPGSIAVAPDGSWIIADTNAHRVARVRPGPIIGPVHADELVVRGAPPSRRGTVTPRTAGGSLSARPLSWFTVLLELPEGQGLASGAGAVTLLLESPEGGEFSRGAPVRAALEVSRRSDLLRLASSRIAVDAEGGRRQTIAIPVDVATFAGPAIEAELILALDYIACDATDQALCTPRSVHLRVPVRLLESGSHDLAFSLRLPAPEPTVPPPAA